MVFWPPVSVGPTHPAAVVGRRPRPSSGAPGMRADPTVVPPPAMVSTPSPVATDSEPWMGVPSEVPWPPHPPVRCWAVTINPRCDDPAPTVHRIIDVHVRKHSRVAWNVRVLLGVGHPDPAVLVRVDPLAIGYDSARARGRSYWRGTLLRGRRWRELLRRRRRRLGRLRFGRRRSHSR